MIFSILPLIGCTKTKNMEWPRNNGIGFLPPQNMSWPRGVWDQKVVDRLQQKLDESCLSGIMQTGGNFFQEINQNAITRMEKLLLIKNSLESIKTNASEKSKAQLAKQLDIINEMMIETEKRNTEIKENPNNICQKKEELKQMNKRMREKIMWLSWEMKTIREHEQNEWIFQYIGKIFGLDRKNVNPKYGEIKK